MKAKRIDFIIASFLVALIVMGYVLFNAKNGIDKKLEQIQGDVAENKGLVKGLSSEISLVKEDVNNNLQGIKKDVVKIESNVSLQNKKLDQVENQLGIQLVQLVLQKQEIETQQQQLEKISQKEAQEQANIENAKKSVVVITYTIQETDGSVIQTFSNLCSGVIYKQNGQIISVMTNQHCVDWKYLGWGHYDASESGQPEIVSETLEVSTINGIKHTVTSIQKAVDGIDLAIMTFQSSSGELFDIPSIFQSLPTVGDDAVAIGSPSGLAYTTTKGIVSALRQASYIQGGKIVDIVQTDAAINPGNSGGGLFRLSDGKLIGINTFGYANTEGLNFAISTTAFGDFS